MPKEKKLCFFTILLCVGAMGSTSKTMSLLCTNNKHIPILTKRELRLRQAMNKDELSYDNCKISMA